MTQDKILKTVFTSQSDSIQQVIKRTCIVDYGVITKVLGKNIVRVGISVADSVEDVQVITCTLVTLCSSSLSINIEANVGDKVLVVFPRHYNPKMFNVDNKDPIIDSTCKGYTRLAGLAFLVNQFDPNNHKNNIQVTSDGAFSFTNDKCSITLNSNGYISYEQTENGNDTKLSFSDSGFLIQDKAGNKIESSTTSGSEHILINGHLKVKK